MGGRVSPVEPTGDLTFVHVKLGEHLVVASTDPGFRAAPDAPIWITFEQEHLHLFDAGTEQRLVSRDAPAVVAPPEAALAPPG